MGSFFSVFSQQMVLTTRQELDESIDEFLRNETRQALSTNIIDQHQHDQLVSSFLEIAVGQTIETARNFLHTTNWNIEEAINLFLMNQDNQVVSPRPDETWSDSTTSGSSDSESILSSLFRPPVEILFEGSFEDAKSVSVQANRWLIVNLQSRTEFASHTLNRDVWLNESVSETVDSNFVLWQVYDHTIEGQKISSFYRIDSVPPVVFVIDPITGQMMRMWSGVIESQSFVEDLMKFMDAGPHEHIASLTRNRLSETNESCSSRNNDHQVVDPSWGEEFEEEDKISSRNLTDQVENLSLSEGVEEMEICSPTEVKEEEETCLEFPVLTEEPKGDCDRSLVCNLCVRFPDGRRKQRRFLKSEPIQLLWSFCYSNMEESENKKFKLVQAIPGASKTLDYGDVKTFDQSGLDNSMISVTWE